MQAAAPAGERAADVTVIVASRTGPAGRGGPPASTRAIVSWDSGTDVVGPKLDVTEQLSVGNMSEPPPVERGKAIDFLYLDWFDAAARFDVAFAAAMRRTRT
ncbi:MAG: hypothetical protein BJ554DRAFT_6014, partial [Olpidium bornovanus]